MTGLVYDLSNSDYHALPSISSSGLRDFGVSPANYYALHLAPDRPEDVETVGQRAGTLLHTLVLEPLTFPERYAVGPDVSRATKAWKEWAESITDGRTIIKESEVMEGRYQAASLRAHPEVSQALENGRAEVSAFWTDPETGVECRCRPDWVYDCGDAGVILLDVKTGPANPRDFARQVARMGYDIQAEMYSEGYAIAGGRPVLAFVFAVVETTYPYLSSCCVLDEESRQSGRVKYRRLLNQYAQCLRSGQWPGWEGVQEISVPRYAIETED